MSNYNFLYWDETNSTEEKDKVEMPKQSEEDRVKKGIPSKGKKGTGETQDL